MQAEDKILLEELSQIITEELGISADVVDISKSLFNIINDGCKDTKYETDDAGILFKRLSFDQVISGHRVKIYVKVYNFRNPAEYNNAIANNPSMLDCSSGYYRGTILFIHLNLYQISGQIDNGVALDMIHHEVEHMFQQIKMGKTFGGTENNAMALSKMSSEDDIERSCAVIVYMSQKSEQEAFTNGLYGYLLSNYAYKDNIRDLVDKSTAMEKVKQLRNAVDIISNAEGGEKECMLYGINRNKMIAQGKKAIESMLRRIGRVIIKYHTDIEKVTRHRIYDNNEKIL